MEIVLRRPSGQFMPMEWLIHVVCHELAHIKQMNHSPAFQRVNNAYKSQVRQLQSRGYFGDGRFHTAFAKIVLTVGTCNRIVVKVGALFMDPGLC